MKFVYKGLLPLFIGMALISCAGADSSAQRKAEERPDLFKAGTPVADTLAAKTPEFARSVFKGAIDSVPGEYYYHATGGRVDTLFRKEGGQYRPIASIAYDSINGQNSYKLKKGNYSYTVKDGALEGEVCFPKYVKKYWDNGNPKQIMTGILYRNDQGDFALDSGHNEIYFENGKIYQQSDWKDKQPVAGKLWYENGILYVEMDIPTGNLKSYYENGTIQFEVTGSNAFNKILEFHEIKGLEGSISENVFAIETGHMNGYYDNGKPMGQLQYKEKKPISIKLWHEDGSLYKEGDASRGFYKTHLPNGKLSREVSGKFHFSDNLDVILESASDKRWNKNGILMTEIVFPKYAKWYSDNGILSTELEGALYYDDQGKIQVQDGSIKDYYDNGKNKVQANCKDKLPIAIKEWNENGVLIKDIDFPKYVKEYWDNGKPKGILTGILYRDDQGNFLLESGQKELYHENGKIQWIESWRGKKIVAGKEWNESGVLIKDLDFPKHYKEFWDNGNLKSISTGLLYDAQGYFPLDSGHQEVYFENGKIQGQSDWKNKLPVTSKQWNENGNLRLELVFPKYAKTYSDNGNLIRELEGTLYYDEQRGLQVQNGFLKTYHDNGKTALHQIYKEKKLVSKTAWNESGIVTISAELPNRYREFYDDGKIKAQATGTIVEEDDSFKIKDGTYNEYDQNGEVTYSATYKDFQKTSEK